MNKYISVCIITKNEEKYIEDCLKSVSSISNDIIVLDTGSTDKTIEISSKYANVYTSNWTGSFSDAKNKSISYASGKWIINLSADERLTTSCQENIKSFLIGLDSYKQPIIIYFKVFEYSNDGNYLTSYFKDYIFNNGYGTKYIRPIHEYLTCENENILRLTAPFLNIIHVGETRNKQELFEKKIKYISQLLDLIKNNPDRLDNYYYYRHLGDEYFETEQHDKSLQSYYSSYELMIEANHDKMSSFYQSVISRIIKELIFFHKNYEKALVFLKEQLVIFPNSPEALFHFGYCKNRLGEYKLGISSHTKALSLLDKNDINKAIISNLNIEIGRFTIINDNNNGIDNLLEAHSLFPKSKPIIRHIIRYYLVNNQKSKAINFLHKINSSYSEKNIISELKKESHWERQEIESLKSIFPNFSF
jgi:glycosyltransferase involved in cell wall biosynthesis